jgi:hypothetical protein
MAGNILGPCIQKHAVRSSHVIDTVVVVIAVFVFGGSGVFSGSGVSGSGVNEFFMCEWSDQGDAAPSCVYMCAIVRTTVLQHHHVGIHVSLSSQSQCPWFRSRITSTMSIDVFGSFASSARCTMYHIC